MDKEHILDILEQRKSLHIENPIAYKYWDILTNLLTQNVEDIVLFFNECTENQVLWFSEIFEDITYKLQDTRFIECLEMLTIKYPNIPIRESIQTAKEYMY